MSRVNLNKDRFIVKGIEIEMDQERGTWVTRIDLEQLVLKEIAGWVVDDFTWPVVGRVPARPGQPEVLCLFAYARVRCVNGSIVWGDTPWDMGEYGTDQIGNTHLVEAKRADRAIVSMISEDGGTTWQGWNIVLWDSGFRSHFDNAPLYGDRNFQELRVTPFEDGFILAFVSCNNAYMMYTDDGRTWSRRRYLFTIGVSYDGLPMSGVGARAPYWGIHGIDGDGDGRRELLMTSTVVAAGYIVGGSGYCAFYRLSADSGKTWTPWKWLWAGGNSLPMSYGVSPGHCTEWPCKEMPWWWTYSQTTWSIRNWQGYAAYIHQAPVRAYVTHSPKDDRWWATLGLFTTGSNAQFNTNCMASLRPVECCGVNINYRWGGMYLLLFERVFTADVTADNSPPLDSSSPMPSACFTPADVNAGYTLESEPDSRAVHWWVCNGYFYEPYGPTKGYHRVSMAFRNGPTGLWCPDQPGVGAWGGKLYRIEGMLWHPDYMSVTELSFQRAGLAGTWLNVREPCSWPFSAAWWDNGFGFDAMYHPEKYYTTMTYQTKHGAITLDVTKTLVWMRTMDDPQQRDVECWFGTRYYETRPYTDDGVPV